VLIFSLSYVNYISARNSNDKLITEANRLVSEGNDYVSGNSYQEAETCFLKSIELWNQVKVYNEYKAYPFYSMAILYRKTGNFYKSIEYYILAEEILLNAREEYKYLLGGIYSSMGNLYILYGDYVKALAYLDKSIQILEGLKERNETIYSAAMFSIAQAYCLQKKFQQSIILSNKYLKEKNAVSKSQFERLIGSCLLGMNNNIQAISILEKSLLGFKTDLDKYSETLLITSKAYLRAGNLEKAEVYLKIALPLLNKYKTETDSWNIYYYEMLGQLNMAKADAVLSLESKQNLLFEALNVFDKALLINSGSEKGGIPYLDIDGNFITPTQVKDIFINRAKVLSLIANNYEKTGGVQQSMQFLDLSLKTWDATVRFLRDFKASFLEDESKLSLSETQVDVYFEGFSIAFKLYNATGMDTYFEQMLYFSESGKSSSFLASMNSVQAHNFGGLPDSLLRSERELNMQITSLKQLIFNEKSNSSQDSLLLKGWENNLFNLQKKHDELMFSFESNYPNYFKFKYSQKIVSTDEIISKLKYNQALIEYFIDEPVCESDSGTINALLFTPSGYSIHYTKVGYSYVKNLKSLLDQLSNRNVGETNLADFNEYLSSASYLNTVLIEPLGIDKSIKSLIIIPDGKLAYLPFDALITSKPDTTRISFSAPDYLVRHYNMVYSYSATLHFDYFKGKKHKNDNILAFAPEYPGGEVDINKEAYRFRQMYRSALRPLPGALEEVTKLSDYHNCKAYIGLDATESVFKMEAANYDILHLAMHTIMNDSIPMFSKLVFSGSSDSAEDGYLNTQEIYNMKLNARLSVLSACNTGSGQMRAGEGVMSLARAFLYAGCPSIVMTLWEVEDKSSAKLMLDFYRYLFKGYSKPEAIQKAKLEHLKNADPLKAHPYFWMGYIIVGDPSPLKYQNKVVVFILIFSAILFIFLCIVRKALKRGIGLK